MKTSQSQQGKKILIQTPIFYPNSKPHIGTAHTVILADFFNRGFKLFGRETYFTTGLDEHGNKVFQSAGQEDIHSFLDEKAKMFRDLFSLLQIDYDKFVRTTDPAHKSAVLHVWDELKKKDLIYEGKYSGYYCSVEETFFQEEDLVSGKSPQGHNVQWAEEQCFFFRSSAFRDQLLEIFSQNNLTTPTNRINELKSFIREELKDLCLSRKNAWGIKVEGDSTIYVWFDALLNYLSSIGYPQQDNWDQYEVIHLMGKDIITFHGIHWITVLLALNKNLPKKLLVHNWWLLEDKKMSKSLGNIVFPLELVEKYKTPDLLRFYCIFHNLIGNDAVFSEKDMVDLHNNLLVNKFSNLIYRLWSLLEKSQNATKQYITNESFEHKLHQSFFDLNISRFLEVLFAWCDDLNGRFESFEGWKNLEKAKSLFHEALQLSKYFTIICPSVQKVFQSHEPVILFRRLDRLI